MNLSNNEASKQYSELFHLSTDLDHCKNHSKNNLQNNSQVQDNRRYSDQFSQINNSALDLNIGDEIQLTEEQRQVVMNNNELLSDDHIDCFAQLLSKQFNFAYRPCWSWQHTELCEPLPKNRSHIQILHSCGGTLNNLKSFKKNDGHWVCCYYKYNRYNDTASIFILDSLPNGEKCLHERHELFLRQLFRVNENFPEVTFLNVPMQPDSYSCGVFAIAFAVSIVLKENISEIDCNVNIMRNHLLKIFDTRLITPFPKECVNEETVFEFNDNSIISYKVDHNKNRKRIYTASDSYESTSFKRRKYKKKVTNAKSSLPYHSDISIIRRGERLNDLHIDDFAKILKFYSDYEHQPTVYLQTPHNIEPISRWKSHIQILYSSNEHWVCSFYDGNKIFIYDSYFSNTLHNDHIIYLQHLFPFCETSQIPIEFPEVQKQCNADDCGIFVIAYAVSLLFKVNPTCVEYNHGLMREHLIKIISTNTIEHFPVIFTNIPIPDFFSLQNINKKEYFATKQREQRIKKEINKSRQNSAKASTLRSASCLILPKSKILTENDKQINKKVTELSSLDQIIVIPDNSVPCNEFESTSSNITKQLNVQSNKKIIKHKLRCVKKILSKYKKIIIKKKILMIFIHLMKMGIKVILCLANHL